MNRQHPIAQLLDRRVLQVLGINSGTSMDGLDGALVAISPDDPKKRIRVIRTFSQAFPRTLGNSLARLASQDRVSMAEAAGAHFALGEFIAASACTWARGATRVDLVASHGQTIAHYPEARRRLTWQIGCLNSIAQGTGKVTIGDFRPADVAAGGMGAPLSGYYHHLLFGPGVAVLNIGGIANVSISRLRARGLQVFAFDTGPGNMIIDAIAQQYLGQRFDRYGRMAARGVVDEPTVRRVLAQSFFRKSPPKTSGREQFGWEQMAPSLVGRNLRPHAADLLATATEVTARSISDAVNRWIAPLASTHELVLTGGGAHNRTLVRHLQAHLPDWKLLSADDWDIPSRYVEPVGFAVLAVETLHARPGNLGGATGARRPAVLGLIALPPPVA
jgi:anhydro-N-acetylmuramic acid kinase